MLYVLPSKRRKEKIKCMMTEKKGIEIPTLCKPHNLNLRRFNVAQNVVAKDL